MWCFEETTSLVLCLVALAIAFKNVRNMLLINHNDGFIDGEEFVVLYNLNASRNLDFPHDSYAPFHLEELDESKIVLQSFALENEIYELQRKFCKSLT